MGKNFLMFLIYFRNIEPPLKLSELGMTGGRGGGCAGNEVAGPLSMAHGHDGNPRMDL